MNATHLDLRLGDCLESLRAMPSGSAHCVVTSPPYFGLRDYGVEGQIGLEQTPAEYIAKLVEVFREVRRVLRDDGTLWLNLGDSYASSAKGSGGAGKSTLGPNGDLQNIDFQKMEPRRFDCGVPDKNLLGIPWRIAFALQDDGWYLRQDIIWSKPNPMPESVRDRCTKAHEYLFLLTKSPRYYFDADAIKEPATHAGRVVEYDGTQKNSVAAADPRMRTRIAKTTTVGDKRNRRSVWTVATRPYKGAHFATFPPDLIEPCILAGCPNGGIVLDPFGGSGTTAGVALALGRRAILCELNPEYAALVGGRVAAILGAYGKRRAANDNQMALPLGSAP